PRRCASFGKDNGIPSVRLQDRGASVGSGGRSLTGAAKNGMCDWRRRVRSASAASPTILGHAAGICRGRMTEYVELHSRSAFSFLEGASLPEALIARAAELEVPAMALLDRNGVYGAPRLHMEGQR